MARSQQIPIRSGHDATTTAAEVLAGTNLEGRLAIVTGGYVGVGLETTRALSAAGATVVVPARTVEKARAALAGVPRVEVEALDLIDPGTVDAFASRFLASGRAVHMLVNNAGIMATPLAREANGIESQLATNHLGHFRLAVRLWPALVKAKGARVVALSSRGHVRGKMDLTDPGFERRPYDKWVAYGQSKTANVLFAVALDTRGEPHGIRAFAVHPGAILTELTRSLSSEELDVAVARANSMKSGLKTAEQGAATSVWCAASPQLEGMGGVYCEDVDISTAVPADSEEPAGVRPWAIDPDVAERLWTKSEEWTGVSVSA